MAQDPLREACWRFEQISPLLEPQLTASERRRMIEEMGRVCVRWPSGREEPIPKSTTYRWLKAYRKDPRIESLMRAPRKRKSTAIKPEWVRHALALLEEDARRSLFILCLRIKHRFDLENAPSRASLHRALVKQPRYIKLRRRARGERKLRRRFQARKAHDIWHADAKGAFMVRFTDGTRLKVQVLTILDDATRFVLAALVVASESLAAAVATFRAAAARWGLPVKFYADRGSAYDSDAFRKGLAVLGCHRINTKSRSRQPSLSLRAAGNPCRETSRSGRLPRCCNAIAAGICRWPTVALDCLKSTRRSPVRWVGRCPPPKTRRPPSPSGWPSTAPLSRRPLPRLFRSRSKRLALDGPWHRSSRR